MSSSHVAGSSRIRIASGKAMWSSWRAYQTAVRSSVQTGWFFNSAVAQ